jgi:hypothetical protein
MMKIGMRHLRGHRVHRFCGFRAGRGGLCIFLGDMYRVMYPADWVAILLCPQRFWVWVTSSGT